MCGHLSLLSVVVCNLNFCGTLFRPNEANAPLAVDAYRILALPAAFQSLKTVSRRGSQITKFIGNVQHRHLPGRCSEHVCRKPFSRMPLQHMLGQLAFGALDHESYVSRHDTCIKVRLHLPAMPHLRAVRRPCAVQACGRARWVGARKSCNNSSRDRTHDRCSSLMRSQEIPPIPESELEVAVHWGRSGLGIDMEPNSGDSSTGNLAA